MTTNAGELLSSGENWCRHIFSNEQKQQQGSRQSFKPGKPVS